MGMQGGGAERAAAHAEIAALIPLMRKQGKGGQLALGQALVLQGEALLMERKRAEAVQPLAEALTMRRTLLWEGSPDIAEAQKLLDEARNP